MRFLDAAELSAIQARVAVARNLLWITGKDRTTGDPVSRGFWNEVRNVIVPVVDGLTGLTVSDRVFQGVGEALQIGAIPLTSDLTIRNVDVSLPHLDSIVEDLVRGYDVRGAPVQIYRAYLHTSTGALLASAKARFIGYVDGAPIETPSEGEEGQITLRCVSTTRELTRTSPEVRSHESQKKRTGNTDDFYKDTSHVGEWEVQWGQKRKKRGKKKRD